MRLKRFTPTQKAFHALLMLSFLIQSVTGMARMYIETSWGQMLANTLGGYDNSLVIHKAVGIFMLILFVCHLIYAIFILFTRKLDKEDSLMPGRKDLRQFLSHMRWMIGGQAPRFDRWGYWEKFDYWAVFWGMVVLGVTGVMLYSPLDTSQYFKGWSLNVALWVHRIEAALAMLHVFLIHFAIAHLRRHNFPMDRAMFSGDTNLESVEEERPAWIDRLRVTGELDQRIVTDAPVISIVLSSIIGLSAVAMGIYLVVGGILNINFVNW
ncbi:MAG: cytochrome C [Desulfovibrio sp.]|nr:cytochrome C [Desulfovibrio sp.]|tara:strand:- start:7836 stop:8636 length:801 start_codon:yes stop_codon:yes gene_type:complete